MNFSDLFYDAVDPGDVLVAYRAAIVGLSSVIVTLAGVIVVLFKALQRKERALAESQLQRVQESEEHKRELETILEEIRARKRKK